MSHLSLHLKFYLIFLLGLLSQMSLSAQDKIITTQDKTINCRISKVLPNEIQYFDEESVIKSISKFKVKQVSFGENPRNPIDFADNHNVAIKVGIYALAFNGLVLSYEKALDPSTSFEITAKVYGVSIKPFEDYKRGGAVDVGFRFRLGDIVKAEQKITHHVLDGVGVKPVIGASYARTIVNGDENKYYYVQVGTILNYQIILANRFLFELYGGIHIYKGKSTITLPNTPPLTGVLSFDDGDLHGEDNTAYSFGVKFGYLFGGFDTDHKMLRW